MIYTIRRLAVSLATLPVVFAGYGVIYFGLALMANSFASVENYVGNLTAIGIAWVITITFSKQILDRLNRIGE